jgi:hypothetical protein
LNCRRPTSFVSTEVRLTDFMSTLELISVEFFLSIIAMVF